ncbi:transposase [Plakobranchus ocellatus]|uniref:Transposase n=1 Tax=Plakobranchus ocellatus TaxID=259542 RepID=A0AAV4A1T3_9GAST|nr:transposase [Plakobranchus ocellatus]
MATSNDLLIKQSSVIEFLAAEGCSAANIHARMKTVYGGMNLPYKDCFRLQGKFAGHWATEALNDKFIILKFTLPLLNVIPVEIDAFLLARQQRIDTHSKEINVKISKPIPHPAHSPDLAPSDFHLFGHLKRHLGGMAFEAEDNLISELRNWFDKVFCPEIVLLLYVSPLRKL